jgi:hypothetical protein
MKQKPILSAGSKHRSTTCGTSRTPAAFPRSVSSSERIMRLGGQSLADQRVADRPQQHAPADDRWAQCAAARNIAVHTAAPTSHAQNANRAAADGRRTFVMKIAMLARNPKLYSHKRLKEAAEARGHEI